MGSPLLEYAEALRTGRDLWRARKLRPRLLKTNPVSIRALDEVMPHKCPRPKRGSPPKRAAPPPPDPLDASRRNAGMRPRRDLGSSIEASVKRRVREM